MSLFDLIQIDASVDCSFWLVALEEGLHGLVTHAHVGKVLSQLLQQRWKTAIWPLRCHQREALQRSWTEQVAYC